MEVFFLAFANDEKRPLPYLRDEGQAVYDYAIMKSGDRHFLTYYEPFATTQRLIKKIIDFQDDISVFLFSGHAEDVKILLGDGVADSEGIAWFLQKSVTSGALKLVVLNGCGTKPAVKEFLKMGVPFVIATDRPVADKSAAAFSESFFRSLIQDEKTIAASFQDGLSAAKLSNKPLNDQHREIKAPGDVDKYDGNTPFWGLFSSDKQDPNRTVIPPRNTDQYLFRVNEKLLKTLYTVFYNEGSEEVRQVWQEEQKLEKNPAQAGPPPLIRRSQKEAAVCEAAPMPIAIQLEMLLNYQVNSPRRRSGYLFQLGQLFQSTVEFLGFIMVSQLWEVKLQCAGFQIEDEMRSLLRKFFNAGTAERDKFDYGHLILSISQYLQRSCESAAIGQCIKKQAIVADFMKIDEVEFAKATGSMLHIRKESYNQLSDDLINQYSRTGEEHLCKLFSMLGFIHKYQLKSIRNIETVKRRFDAKSKTQFFHTMYSYSRNTYDNTEFPWNDYVDSYAQIISVKKNASADWAVDCLNLSPFVIDIQSFDDKDSAPRIMFFDAMLSPGVYLFKDTRNPNLAEDKAEVKDNPGHRYKHILAELNEFSNTML